MICVNAVVRSWLTAALAIVALAAAPPGVAQSAATGTPPPPAAPLKIGIIGAGHIGGTLAALWVRPDTRCSSPRAIREELEALARSLGPKARVGTPREAALFGDVVLVSVPYAACRRSAAT